MQTSQPLITIGMCCYNSQDTVERAIKSALAQDYPNYELLVVDDGSSDKTPQIIMETIKDHDFARFIQHETNKTFPGALNTVIKEARGEFIAIFDDDDASLPERLSIQHRTIVEYEAQNDALLIACWGSGVRKYPNGYEVDFKAIGSQEKVPIGTDVVDRILYYGSKEDVFYGSGTPSCSLMTRKSTFEAVGLYDTTMFRSEDADFAIRLGLKGGHFIGCSQNVIEQYSTGGSEKSAQIMYDSYLMVVEKYKEYLIERNRYTYAKLWLRLRLHHFGNQKLKAIGVLTRLFFQHPILTWKHFWDTAPKRLAHEWKMNRDPQNSESI